VPDLWEALKADFNCPAASLSGSGPQWSDKAPARGCPELELVNLGEGGETTPSMIEEQFPVAIPLLEARNLNRNPRDDVEVTTVHIGGNDVFGPIIGACLGPSPGTCLGTIQDEFSHYQTDLNNALSMLREAAGDKAKIVIGTYDNPFRDQSPLTCLDLAGNPAVISLGNLALEGGPGVPQGLHDIMRSVAADHGIEVAEVFGDLDKPEDWFDCLHPTDLGYDKVTDAFDEALGLS
jgi:hypothetical protein